MAKVFMYKPVFTITSSIALALMKIESLKQEINGLPITPLVLKNLRETARIESTHFSTYIEGNRLTEEEVKKVIYYADHFPGKERDEKEVLGYYAALDYMDLLASKKDNITETIIKKLHALIMAGGKKKVKPIPYRDGQNVIRDSLTRKIVYLPPEAQDVPKLMEDLVNWINKTESEKLPCPIRAGIAHYEFATIHPYYDGNGRTARLLTTLILHLGGYGLKGLYSLEEYYAKNLQDYYQSLTIGPSHNYYLGRVESDITTWIEFFCSGMVDSFEHVKKQALKAQQKGQKDLSSLFKKMDSRQRKMLLVFKKHGLITAHDVARAFGVQPRTARALCQQWVQEDFFVVLDSSKKNRKYGLSRQYDSYIS